MSAAQEIFQVQHGAALLGGPDEPVVETPQANEGAEDGAEETPKEGGAQSEEPKEQAPEVAMVHLPGIKVDLPIDQVENLAILGDGVVQKMKTAEGRVELFEELRTRFEEAGQEMPGVAKAEAKPAAEEIEVPEIDIDEDGYVDPKSLNLAFKQITKLVKQTAAVSKADRDALLNKLQEFSQGAVRAETATTSAQLVQQELGISKTPAEIKTAMERTKIDDPVRACREYYWSEIKSVLSKPKAAGKPADIQPVQESRKIDTSKMTVTQLIELAKTHPEIVPPEYRD